MMAFPHDIITCLPRDGYTTGRASSFYVLRTLKGRARYRHRDEYPSYTVGVTLDLSQSQYATWQAFYASINYGADRFLMYTDIGAGVQEKTTHMLAPPVATLGPEHRWKVQLELEVERINQ